MGKLWYRAASVSLWQSDFKSITKLVKQFIYNDLQIRPSDLALYHPVLDGGLGLIHTESKCQALLARTFIETAFGGKFRKNLTNVELYNKKILLEEPNFHIEFSPFYNKSFCETLKYIKETSTKNIQVLSLKEIYNIILEQNVLKDNEGNKILLNVEQMNSWIDWGMAWRVLRMRGIPPNLASTMWKAIYFLLKTGWTRCLMYKVKTKENVDYAYW